MNSHPFPGAIRTLLVLLCAFLTQARAIDLALGTELTRIPRIVKKFAVDPMRARIYGTTSVNTVIAIDTRTFALVGEIPIGSNPQDLDISPDGTRLYVANSGSTVEGVGVVDLTNFTKLPGLPTPDFTYSVRAGLNNRLFVTGEVDHHDYIIQLDATTGAVQQLFGDLWTHVDSALALTPDRKTLFLGTRGYSPASLSRYDVTDAIPVAKESTQDVGGNGRSIVINPAGTALCYSTGSGQSNYGIALIPTANVQQTFGIMHCDAYPGPGAFNPDGTRFFTAPDTQNLLKVYNTATYQETGRFVTTIDYGWLDVYDIAVSQRGGQLYVANENEIVVYSTGQSATLQLTSDDTVATHLGEAFSYQLTWNFPGITVGTSSLPPGLQIDENGLITGTPTAAGTYTIDLSANDPVGDSKHVIIELDVLAPVTVNVNLPGTGTVTEGYAGTTWRKLGSAFVLTATPETGYAFANWSGATGSSQRSITVVVTGIIELTANFLPGVSITVDLEGPGQVTDGFAGTTVRLYNSDLSITATPDLGARFTGWTGDIVSIERGIFFTANSDKHVTAHFERMSSYAGTYQLLADPDLSAFGPHPVITILVNTSGSFSGKMTFAGKRYGFSGDFLSPEGFQLPIQLGDDLSGVIHLALSQSGGIPQITGALTLGDAAVPLNGYRLGFHSKLQPAPQAGKYNWGAPAAQGAERPGGASFGTARVTTSGTVTFAGVFGDGTPFTAGSKIADGGFAIIDAPIYAKKGSLSGTLQFRDQPDVSDFDGTLVWNRPARQKGVFVPGFAADLEVIGSRLATPLPNTNLLSGPTATLTFENGALTSPQTASVTILAKNKFIATAPNALSLRLQLSASSQALTGSFIAPGSFRRTPFKGRLLAKPQRAFAQFRTATDYGSVTLATP